MWRPRPEADNNIYNVCVRNQPYKTLGPNPVEILAGASLAWPRGGECFGKTFTNRKCYFHIFDSIHPLLQKDFLNKPWMALKRKSHTSSTYDEKHQVAKPTFLLQSWRSRTEFRNSRSRSRAVATDTVVCISKGIIFWSSGAGKRVSKFGK